MPVRRWLPAAVFRALRYSTLVPGRTVPELKHAPTLCCPSREAGLYPALYCGGGLAPAGTVHTSTLRPGCVAVLTLTRLGSMPLDFVRYVLAFCARCMASDAGSFPVEEPDKSTVLPGSC